jgi:hypothetical protein
MGMLGLSASLGISTPLTAAQLPFPLFINGNDLSPGTPSAPDALTYRLSDGGFAGPQLFSFTIHDHTLAVRPWIAKQQRVLWRDAVADRYLYHGFIKDLEFLPIAIGVDIMVTCSDLSEGLDYGRPIQTWDAGVHGASDRTQIQSLLAKFAHEPSLGSGGFIQVLNAAMPASLPTDRTTLRNAIDKVLGATGVTGAVAYVDVLGYLHTMALGDVNAPYNITDNAPNGTTTVGAKLTVKDQGALDVDALLVYGGTDAGSGAEYSPTVARHPLRWATLDAPQAVDAATRHAAALVEFQRRQNVIAVSLEVTGYDGWAKGQLVTITSATLGWAAKQFTISAVDMNVRSGNGVRHYVITAGTDPVLFTARLKYAAAQWQSVPVSGQALRGKLGGAGPTA